MDSANAKRQVALSQKQDQWLHIQKNTFTNWVNECLRSRSVVVEDIQTDLSDGINLVYLVESLARKHISGAVARPSNQYEKLNNITMALNTVTGDGVKIVNIDSSDIMAGNLKLILALIWQLILKYQVGLSASQHRAWILEWLRAVIPECSVSNLTTDWNDGILLHALLDFCKPGVSASWRSLDRNNKAENCRSAMKLARQHFNVPLILRPEDLASSQLDERSFITYLSYFIRVGGPGYDATLERVASRTKPKSVSNFTTDWQDGQALTYLVRSAGGIISSPASDGTSNLQQVSRAVNAGKYLGVEPFLTPEDIIEETTEHLGIMAYAANYLRYSNHSLSTMANASSEHLSVSNNNLNLIGSHTAAVDLTYPLKVRTEYRDDFDSRHISTIQSPTQRLTNPEFQLVTKHKSSYTPRVEAPPPEQLKVDVYSVGVIMESKITGTFDPEQFKVEAKSPSGRVIRMSGNGHYAAQFNHNEIGRWDVSMTYAGKYMDGCPIDVCDPSQVTVKDLHGGIAGRPSVFLVDCSRAGTGDLGVEISHFGRPVATHVSRTHQAGLFKVSYTPFSKGPYEVNVHFNRAEIREADFHTFDPEERQRRAVFNTEVEPKNGHVEVKCCCDWEIDYITGGPFVCHVSDIDDIPVYAMTDGTVCGRPELIVDCSNVGEGTVEAEAIHQGKTYSCKVRRDKEKPFVYHVRLKPRGPGTYKVWISYDGRPIKGSPFTQHIAELEGPSAHGDGLYRGVPGQPATFIIDPKNAAGQMSVSVTGPSRHVSSHVETLDNNTVRATYHPTERGLHKVHVKMDGKDIKGSPFQPLIVDPVKVRVSGGWRPLLDDAGIIPLKVNKEKVLPFDVSEAGPGELTSEVQGPNGKIPVTIDARNDGQHSIVFTPKEEGKHYIHVKWGGYPLTNSPYLGHATYSFEDEVDGPGSVRLVQVPLQSPVYMHAPSPASSPAPSSVDGPLVKLSRHGRIDSSEYAKANGFVHGHSDSTRLITTRQHTDHYYNSPTEPRLIHLPDSTSERHGYMKYNNTSYKASRASSVSMRGPQKVVLSGSGVKEAEVDKMAEFKVDGTKADSGTATAHLESVHHIIPVKTEPIQQDVFRCTYTPKYPGAYLLYVNWNGKSLRDSPFKIHVRDKSRPELVTMSRESQGAIVGSDYEIKVDARHAGQGELTATCTDPVGKDVAVRISENYNGTKSIRFKPHMAGRYFMVVRQKGQHINGSPFMIDVREKFRHDLVKLSHATQSGVIGRDYEIKIDSRQAGQGELVVNCTDPLGKDVAVSLTENYDGSKSLKFKPYMAGRYFVQILQGGLHVNGSPVIVDIKAFQQKGQVKAWGPGIEDGIIPHFQSTFWVETTGAGAGDLRVRIMGPKGAFHVKMRKASQKDKIYQCFYDPVEPGMYTVHIQWSGVHVEGSPYTVMLATSAEELARMKDEVREDNLFRTNSVLY